MSATDSGVMGWLKVAYVRYVYMLKTVGKSLLEPIPGGSLTNSVVGSTILLHRVVHAPCSIQDRSVRAQSRNQFFAQDS